jgi:molybdate transport system substrate-binding protein
MGDHVPEPIIVLSTGAYKPALDEILAVFTLESGFASEAVYDSATGVAARIEAGERFDVAISAARIMAALAARDLFSAARWPAGCNEVCLAYREDSAPPDMSTPETLRAVLQAASAISMSDPKHGGGSSKYFMDLLESLGIAAEVSAKLVLTAGGQGAAPVAERRTQFGVAQTSEIAMLPGLAAAPFRGSGVTYELGISARPHPGAAALARFFTGPAGLKIRRKCGLENQ